MRWGCQRNNQRSPKTLLFVFRRFACRPAAFLSVWGGQPEREASLFNLKFLAARVLVYVRQLADGRVFAAVCGQPVFEEWQNSLTSYRDENGKPYAQTYLKCINNQLTAIFNYAVKYYGLKENPCHKAGSMGKKKADEMLFWTKDEFQTFIESMKDRPASYTVFLTMYYTGIREGELLALTPSDIDFEKKTLTVNKSYQRLGKEDIITTPKTPKSIRTIPIPDGLCNCLQEYMSHCYGLQKDDRLFPYTKSFLYHEMEYGCKASGVKRRFSQ